MRPFKKEIAYEKHGRHEKKTNSLSRKQIVYQKNFRQHEEKTFSFVPYVPQAKILMLKHR